MRLDLMLAALGKLFLGKELSLEVIKLEVGERPWSTKCYQSFAGVRIQEKVRSIGFKGEAKLESLATGIT